MRPRLTLTCLAGALGILCLLVAAMVAALPGCGSGGPELGTNAPLSSTTIGPTSSSGPLGTDVTVPNTLPPPSGGSSGTDTTVLTGTTLPGGGNDNRALTFVGPATSATWRAIRDIVIAAQGDGDKILAEVAKLAAGPAVEVGNAEIDAVRGVGYAAGADTSQPVAVATEDTGAQVMVMAFVVTGSPDKTTIVGFERHTYHVVLVEGPLQISDATGNITTVPGQ